MAGRAVEGCHRLISRPTHPASSARGGGGREMCAGAGRACGFGHGAVFPGGQCQGPDIVATAVLSP